jgi:hypothetical protein
MHVSHATLIYTIGRLTLDHRIPVGLEKSSTHKDEAKVNIDLDGGTLREVLDSIVRQEPTYRWEMVDGVINFIPNYDRYRFVASLLETPVSRFVPARGINNIEIRDRILELPEVRRLIASNRMLISRLSDEPSRRSIYEDIVIDLR